MTDRSQTPNNLPWPPLVYLAGVALSIIAHAVYPLPWFGTPFGDILFAIGILLSAGSIALVVGAIRAMRRARTTVAPNKASDHLVTGGVFALSRHPIYLGNTGLMIGIGFIFGIAWFVVLAIVCALIVNKIGAEREEAHLELRFGKAYRDYRKKVRRWI